MVINKRIAVISVLSAIVNMAPVATNGVFASEFSGNVALEGRLFQHDGAFAGQEGDSVSISLQPEYRHRWDNDHKSFTFIPFYRWDSKDDERTHADIRQLDLIATKDDWEIQVGISKVFWGVTESQHLVDIINQTDSVEGPDGEEKLGQPMLRLSHLMDDGSVDLFILPYFRERTFPGLAGRFRTPLVVDTDNPTYESSEEDEHVDYALRLNKTIDEFDVGLYYFDGTSRQPEFIPGLKNGQPIFTPHYALMDQLGFDLQYTGEEIVWKFEAVNRNFEDEKIDDFSAAVGGFEYTFPGVTESGGDLGVLAEYHLDSRGEAGSSPFQKDLFVGARLSLNDEDSSELLAGAFVDLDNGSKSFRVEASRRIGKGFKLNIEGQVFTDFDANDSSNIFSQDDYVQLELQKYF